MGIGGWDEETEFSSQAHGVPCFPETTLHMRTGTPSGATRKFLNRNH
jgi:hypothetical protein